MKKVLFAALVLASCNANKTENVEAKVKAFMQKEYVPNINDPKSYEYVSMTLDTIKGEFNDIYLKDEVFNSGASTQEKLQKVDAIEKSPSKKDSIYYRIANVEIRGKNLYGAVILNTQKVKITNDGNMSLKDK